MDAYKLVVPAKKLSESSKLLKDVEIDSAISLSVIGSGGETSDQFTKSISDDLDNVNEFLSGNVDAANVDVFEVKLPFEIIEQDEADDMLDLMISVSSDLDSSLGKEVPVYYESTLGEKHEENILKVVAASLNNRCGYKLRTAELKLCRSPSSEQIAFTLL
jgi:hypothetical protein